MSALIYFFFFTFLSLNLVVLLSKDSQNQKNKERDKVNTVIEVMYDFIRYCINHFSKADLVCGILMKTTDTIRVINLCQF